MKKTTVFRQVMGLLASHLILSIFLLFVLVGVSGVTEKFSVIGIVVGIIAIAFYVRSMFLNAYSCAEKDHKKHSKTTPYPLKGIVLSIGIVALVGVSWIAFELLWKYAPIEDKIVVPTLVANIIYCIVTAPFWDFVKISGGSANLIGQIMSIVIPFLSCVIGYYLGYIKWDYSKHVDKLVYDKKKDQKEV